MARRLCNWLTHAEFISADADWDFVERYLDSISRQARHLRRAGRFVPDGVDKMMVTKALIYTSLCLPHSLRYVPRHLKAVARMSDRQILPDGGHVERNPAAQVQGLQHLLDIRSILNSALIEIPKQLEQAIDRGAPMLQFFRHDDGGLSLFNGSNEGNPKLIDIVLAKAKAHGKPLTSATHTGFERVVANDTLVIADTGTPSTVGRGAHAGLLSFEMSVGKQRVIVNCGAYAGQDPMWQQAQRATAAHSTLVLTDQNSCEVRKDGSISAHGMKVTAERHTDGGSSLIDVSHNGYVASHGVIHRRRLYINASGMDIRGEDTLDGNGDHKFTIRFHLHPFVKASLVQGGESVLLRLPDKTGWRLRCSGGIASLQESIYLGDGGEPKRTEQIVISGASHQGDAQVKWALAKVTRS
ncbi:MAG: heparinase II/III family protein [Pseudomonadota bacterium]|nr:heparinase II/III family protein [Pseudomonadota bacterium]